MIKSNVSIAVVIIGLMLQTSVTFGQVNGLWLVKKVMVGDKDRTPVARWFRLKNGIQTSGNGWQQHSYGTYLWDRKKSTLSFTTENEPADGAEPFRVTRKNNKMTWNRLEEGERIVVDLEETSDLPQSPADKIKGLWDLESAKRVKKDITLQYDPEGKQYIFIRWDRIYVNQISPNESVTGYWFMNAHEPKLKFISKNASDNPLEWLVSFDKEKMILSGVSENNKDLTLVYKGMKNFPK